MFFKKKSFLSILTIASLFSSGNSYSYDLVPTEPITISVKEVVDRTDVFNNDKNWSKRISNILINELTSTGNFTVIENDPNIISYLNNDSLVEENNNKTKVLKTKYLNEPKYVISASLNDFYESSSSSGGAGVGFFGFSVGNSKGKLSYYVSFDLRVINKDTGSIAFSRTIEGQATADITGKNFAYTSLTGVSIDKNKENITGMNPTRVIRGAIQEISSYLNCVLYLQDQCLVEFKAKDQRRIESNESLDMF